MQKRIRIPKRQIRTSNLTILNTHSKSMPYWIQAWKHVIAFCWMSIDASPAFRVEDKVESTNGKLSFNSWMIFALEEQVGQWRIQPRLPWVLPCATQHFSIRHFLGHQGQELQQAHVQVLYGDGIGLCASAQCICGFGDEVLPVIGYSIECIGDDLGKKSSIGSSPFWFIFFDLIFMIKKHVQTSRASS